MMLSSWAASRMEHSCSGNYNATFSEMLILCSRSRQIWWSLLSKCFSSCLLHRLCTQSANKFQVIFMERSGWCGRRIVSTFSQSCNCRSTCNVWLAPTIMQVIRKIWFWICNQYGRHCETSKLTKTAFFQGTDTNTDGIRVMQSL